MRVWCLMVARDVANVKVGVRIPLPAPIYRQGEKWMQEHPNDDAMIFLIARVTPARNMGDHHEKSNSSAPPKPSEAKSQVL